MITLQICFTTKKSYEEVKYFVANRSEFYGEENDEWNMIEVECSYQQDADLNEKLIEKELIENNFEDFYFEIED